MERSNYLCTDADDIADQDLVGRYMAGTLPYDERARFEAHDLFPQATVENVHCNFDKSEPNDITRTDGDDVRNQSFFNPYHNLPDWLAFALFMRFLDAPQPSPLSPNAQRGQQLQNVTALLEAVDAHASGASDAYGPSEANAVIERFKGIPKHDRQAILDFLRSL